VAGQPRQARSKGPRCPLDTEKRAKARKAKEDGTKAKVEIAIPMFGYKNDIGIDRAHRLVRAFAVTSAADPRRRPTSRRHDDQHGERCLGRHGLSLEGK
jgi:hypothetical protein